MTDFEDQIQRRKLLKGMKDLSGRCHCGKLKVRHTVPEARACMKESKTETTLVPMSQKEISEMQAQKI